MQDTFWTPELWCEFLNQRPLIGALETEMEQFKSSKSPKKEWEIVAFLEESSGTLWKLREDGAYRCDRFLDQPGYPLQSFIDDRDPIHSVRRLSDGEVFSVGDRIKNHSLPIARIVIDNGWTGGIRFECPHENEARGIKDAEKLPQPILTTVDGVEKCVGDRIYPVDKDFGLIVTSLTEYNKDGWANDKVFSTREAAEEYILNSRPLLSLNDVKEKFKANGWSLSHTQEKLLTEMIKQKLNQ